jgi:hypothetical protein
MSAERFVLTLALQRLAEFAIASAALFACYFADPHAAFCEPPRVLMDWVNIAPHVVFEVGFFFVGSLYLPLVTTAQALMAAYGRFRLASLLPALVFAPIAALVILSWPAEAALSAWLVLAIATAAFAAVDGLIAARMTRA